MPSPIGHSLVGLCGAVIAARCCPAIGRSPVTLTAAAVVLANIPDVDVIPGLLMHSHPGLYHHQATHSLLAVLFVFFVAWVFFQRRSGMGWQGGIWASGIYLSHVLMDALVADPTPPYGVQLLWPFSSSYFMSPVPVFASFDYYDPVSGILKSLFSLGNVWTISLEILLLSPFVLFSWYFAKQSPYQHPYRRDAGS